MPDYHSLEAETAGLSILHGAPLTDDPGAPQCLADALARAARGDHGITYLRDKGDSHVLPYAQLHREALRVAAGLAAQGVRPGQPVLLQLTHAAEFLPAFWGCVHAGAVPVPMAVPSLYQPDDQVAARLLHGAERFPGAPLICQPQARAALAGLLAGHGASPLLPLDALLAHAPAAAAHRCDPDQPALYLLTSGSTARPKVVPQTHRRLLARSRATILHNGFHADDVSLNWLPLDHVGGLVMFHLRDVVAGCHQIQAPLTAFLERPLRWLDWCSSHRVTITWAPNFAYHLINQHADEIAAARWDLAPLRFILNGGEPVVASHAHQFMALLRPHGLRDDAMHPAWGMSETCSGIVYNDRFHQLPATRDGHVSVGGPLPGASVRLVDGQQQAVPQGEPGRLQVRGVSVFDGYLGDADANRAAFTADGWFDTGDRGVIEDGQLAIVGRDKDILIINGHNVSAHEIESVIDEVDGVLPSFTAVLPVRAEGDATDRVAAFFASSGAVSDTLLRAVRERLTRKLRLAPDYLVPVTPAAVPKTSIGKIQKEVLAAALRDGRLMPAYLSAGAAWPLLAPTPAGLLHRRVWQETPVPGPAGAVRHIGLAFADDTMQELGNALAARGHTLTRLPLDPHAGPDFPAYLGTQLQIDTLPELIVFAWPTGAGEYGLWNLLSLLQLAGRTLARRRATLLVVGRNVQRVGPGDAPVEAADALPIGVLRAAAQEYPGLTCRHLDIGALPVAALAELLEREAAGCAEREVEVAYRDARRHVARLAAVPARPRRPAAIRPEGRYLVVGGLGGIGSLVSGALLERLQARVAIVGRGTMPAGPALERYEDLTRRHPGRVAYFSANVTRGDTLEQAVAAAQAWAGGKLDGIFNLAGTFASCAIAELALQDIAPALAGKLHGGEQLYRLATAHAIPLVVQFSSVNGYFGGAGTALYAAANRSQEALAERALGVAGGPDVRCLSWAMWQETGLSAGFAQTELTRQRGYRVLTPEAGVAAFWAALAADCHSPLIGIDAANPAMVAEMMATARPQELQEATPAATPSAPTLPPSAPAVTADTLEGTLSAIWVALLELDEPPEPDDNLFDLGGHSLLLPRMQQDIRARTGFEVEAVQLFQYPTVSTLAAHLRERVQAPAAGAARDYEEDIAAVWREVLELEELDPDDNLFDLGGHSLLLPRICELIRQRTSVELQLVELFQFPTLGALAHHVEAQAGGRSGR